MSQNTNRAFADHLQKVANLNCLEMITQNLDKEIQDSQNVMNEIKAMMDLIPNSLIGTQEAGNVLRHEDLAKFLETGVPKLLLPDMAETNLDVDVDEIIASMKVYVEELQKKYSMTQSSQVYEQSKSKNEINIEAYAHSLEQLGKQLANVKLIKKEELHDRNPEFELKFSQLCVDVNMFSEMVQAKTKLSECNKNWTASVSGGDALYYNDVINKLMTGINEVTYMLQNKK